MDIDKAVDFVSQHIYENTGKSLNDSEIKLLEGSLKGWPYNKIAEKENYTAGYLEKQLGPNLWRKISNVLGIPVKKLNIRAVLAEKLRELDSRPTANLSSQEVAQHEVAADSTLGDGDTLVQEVRSQEFLGRDQDIATIRTYVEQGARVIGIYGKGGVGKTTLADEYFERHFKAQRFNVLELRLNIEAQTVPPIEERIEYWLRQYFKEIPERGLSLMLDQLKRKLRTQRVGVLLDNLESALDKNGKFIEAHRTYVELLRVLASRDLQSLTLITSREQLNESKISIKPYEIELKGLPEEAWIEFFLRHKIRTNYQGFLEMYKAYGGNAKAMQILCAAIQKDKAGNLEAYWEENKGDLLIEKELEDLVGGQFERLKNFNPDNSDNCGEYRLLCRLGLYSYQNITKIPIIGLLCLLWDVPKERHKRVIKSLTERYLVEFQDGGYWLHPVIRAEAISRLKLQEELDDILLLMKKEIDKLVALDKNLQFFLKWLNQKSSEVKSPYKPAAIRAFYSDIGFEFSNFRCGIPSELTFNIDQDFAFDCASYKGAGLLINLDNSRSRDIVLDHKLSWLIHDLFWKHLIFFDEQPSGRVHFVSTLDDAINLVDEIKFKQVLQDLRNQLPDPRKEEEKFKKWLEAKSQTWSDELRNAVINHRKIGDNWLFCNEQKKVLEQYYIGNNLLVSCFSSASSPVREKIENTLLLPIAEIKRLQAEGSSTPSS